MVLVVVAGPWGANVLAAERAEPFTGSFVAVSYTHLPAHET